MNVDVVAVCIVGLFVIALLWALGVIPT